MKNEIRRRVAISGVLVAILYVASSFVLPLLWADAEHPVPLLDSALDTLGGLAIPALVVWSIACQVWTRKFYPDSPVEQAPEEDVEPTRYGVNGLPLNSAGYDVMGNFQGIDLSSSDYKMSDD